MHRQEAPAESSGPEIPGQPGPVRAGEDEPASPGLALAPLAHLTAREREVLELLGAGVPARRIAVRLAVQEATVRSHIRTIFRKLGCHSQLEAIALGRALGIVGGAPAFTSPAQGEPGGGAATDGAPGRRRLSGSRRSGYRLLAEILAGCVVRDGSGPDGPEQAGRAWGRYLADRPPLSPPLSEEESLVALVAFLAEIGFGAEVAEADGSPRILVHRCPFRDVAQRHDDVVCAVHLGLIRGALAEFGGRLEVGDLRLSAKSGACELALRPADGAGPARL